MKIRALAVAAALGLVAPVTATFAQQTMDARPSGATSVTPTPGATSSDPSATRGATGSVPADANRGGTTSPGAGASTSGAAATGSSSGTSSATGSSGMASPAATPKPIIVERREYIGSKEPAPQDPAAARKEAAAVTGQARELCRDEPGRQAMNECVKQVRQDSRSMASHSDAR